jgi:hypothetical protein
MGWGGLTSFIVVVGRLFGVARLGPCRLWWSTMVVVAVAVAAWPLTISTGGGVASRTSPPTRSGTWRDSLLRFAGRGFCASCGPVGVGELTIGVVGADGASMVVGDVTSVRAGGPEIGAAGWWWVDPPF